MMIRPEGGLDCGISSSFPCETVDLHRLCIVPLWNNAHLLGEGGGDGEGEGNFSVVFVGLIGFVVVTWRIIVVAHRISFSLEF